MKTAKKPAGKKAAAKKTVAPKPAAKKTVAKKTAAKKTAKPAKPAPTPSKGPRAGDTAPGFVLPAANGGAIDLAALRGKPVLLYFYPKDDTPGCTVEACGFRDRFAELQERGAVVLGVSKDSVASHQKFRDKYSLPFELLSDPDAQVIAAYGSWGEKNMMGRKYMGILRRSVLIGADGRVKKVYDKVKPDQHAEEVLADLAALA